MSANNPHHPEQFPGQSVESIPVSGKEGMETTYGFRFVDKAEVNISGIDATLFSITEQRVDAAQLVEDAAAEARDQARSMDSNNLLAAYHDERWLTYHGEGGNIILPFAPVETYLDHPNRADQMTIEIDNTPFKLPAALQPFKDQLIAEQLASGRNISDGANTAVASFDHDRNVLRLREVGYFDMFVTQNFGPDTQFNNPVTINGHQGKTIRELAGYDRLPDLNEDSLVANSLGLGGVLKTADGKFLLSRRKGNLGVASASGTFGFSAAGNLPWTDELRRSIDTSPAHEALTERGIAKESEEELGLLTQFKSPSELFVASMAQIAGKRHGLNEYECSATPLGIMRDAAHMGHLQTAYYLETPLSSDEVIERMLHSPDARKEYDLILAIDAEEKNLESVIRNDATDMGINFNLEIRATLALLLSQEHGRQLIRSR